MSTYKQLERRITSGEGTAVLARWEFGGKLLNERREHGGKQLPNGRLAEVAAEVGKSEREVHYRIQFAELCETEEEVRSALRTYESWHTLIRDFITAHRAEQEAEAPEGPAFTIPAPDREADTTTEEMTGDAPGSEPRPTNHSDAHRKVQQMLTKVLQEIRAIVTRMDELGDVSTEWHARYAKIISDITDELRKLESQLVVAA